MINSDTKYAYSVGKIRALETRLINFSMMEKIWQQPNFNSIAGFLEDEYRPVNFTEDNFESLLDEHLGRVIKTLKTLVLDRSLFGIFLLKYDFHNLKVLVEKLSDDFILPDGNFTKEELAEMVKTSDFGRFGKICGLLPARLFAIFHQDKKKVKYPVEKLEQLFFDAAITTVKKYKNDFLVSLLKKQIDMKNMNTFYRTIKQKKGKDYLNLYLLNNGYVDRETFLISFSNPASLKIPQYEKLLITKTDFEKAADDFITEYISIAKRISFGIEPFIGYIWAKEIEMKNIRLILYGKINNLTKEEVFNLLRVPYVQ